MPSERFINSEQYKANLELEYQSINKSLQYHCFKGRGSANRLDIVAFFVTNNQHKMEAMKAELAALEFTHLETKNEDGGHIFSQFTKSNQELDLSRLLLLTQMLASISFKSDVKFKGFATHVPPFESQEFTGENSMSDWCSHAAKLSRQGEYEKAEVLFAWLLSRDPMNASFHFERAFHRQAHKDYLGAVDDFEFMLQICPESDNGWCCLGECYISINEYGKAIECFTKAIELDPDDFTYYHYRAKVFFYLDRIDEACVDWAKAKLLGDDFWAPQYLKHRFMKMD